jgi:hypothetical protein
MSIMVSKKELLDEAIDHAITMRNVRKLSPVRDNNFGVYAVTILSIDSGHHEILWVSFLADRNYYRFRIFYCLDES